MKKITLILTLLFVAMFSWQSNAQTICTDSFTATGPDSAATAVTVVPGDITCNNGEAINTITLVNSGGSLTSVFCDAAGGSWYNFTLNIDGVDIVTGCATDFNNYVVPPTFTTLSITSADTDNYTDTITISFDLEIDHVPPSCQTPTDLAVSAVMTTQATVTWTELNTPAPAAEYVVVPVGDPAPTGAGTTLTNGGDITGLTASSIYDLYVRDDCGGGDFSDWAGPVLLTMQCDAFGDFSENFDATADGELTLCWYSKITSTDAAAKVEVDSGEVEFFNGADTASELILITPELTDLPSDTHRIRFNASGPTGSALQIGTMDSPTGTFTPVFGFALSTTDTEYAYNYIASTTDGYVALKAVLPAASSTVKLDDFNWEQIPSCIEPGTLTVSGVTATDVTIAWVENGTATEWEYAIQPAGTGEPVAAGTSTMTNPVTDTSLAPITDYEVYVRAVCGVGDESIWIGPVTFTTPCAVFTPYYVENFASMTGFSSPAPDCWEEAGNGDVAGGPINLGSGEWSSEEFAHTSTSGGGAVNINLYNLGTSDWLISPEFDLSAGGYEVVLDVALTAYNSTYQVGFGSDDEVQLLYTEDGTTWNNLMTWNLANQPSETGETVTVALASTASVVKFALWGYEGTVDDPEDIDFHIDNFKVRIPPTCMEATDVVISAETMTGATIAWTENNDPVATTWDLYIVPTGDAAPDAAAVPTVNDTTTNPHVWAGGMVNTTYDVYVRVDCGADNTDVSLWTGASTFTTNCSVFTAPYTEDFEDAGSIDICWDMNGGEDWRFSDTGSGNHLGNNGTMNGSTTSGNFFAWVDDSSPDNNDVTLTSPVINVDALTTPALYFYLLSDNEGNASATLNVEVYDGTTWANIATLSGNLPEWTNQVISLSGYTGDIQVRFIVADSTSFYDDIAIDDVVIDEAPTCFIPESLMVSDITAVGATFALTEMNDPNATVWDFYVVPSGDAAPDAVSVPTVNDGTNPNIWAGGAESTAYDVYVRSDCGADNTDVSLWVGPETFTTNANCITPIDLTVNNIDSAAGTADLAWTDNNVVVPVNGWEYEIVDITAGGTATGTGIATATNPVSVTGLVADNQYEFLVRAVCGAAGSESEWSTAYAWTQMDVPGCVSNPMPADTAVVPVGVNTFTWDAPVTGGAVVAYDIHVGVTMALEFGVIDSPTTETIDLTLSAYATTYYYQIVPTNAGGDATGCPIWSFTTEDSPGCGDAFTDFNGAGANYSSNENRTWTITPDTPGDVVTVTFTAFNTESGYDGLMIYDGPDATFPVISSGDIAGDITCPAGSWRGTTNTPTVITSSDASGALTFVFTSDGSVQYAGWEADITCAAPSVCSDPTNLAASDITDLTASLSWDENSTPAATAWDIEWGVDGFTQGMGTMVTATADNPYALSDLTAETDYEFYVRANCSVTYQSAWVGPFAFSTIATPTCLVPTGLTATDITDVSANLAWTDANDPAASMWDIEWGTAGFTQGTGTLVDDTTDNPYALADLTAETDYEFYVSAVCSGADSSTWAGPFTFTTAPTPPSNDNCLDAISLTIGADFAAEMVVGTNVGATDSGITNPTCSNYNGGDVWYSVVIPSDGIVTIDTNNIDFTDSGMAIYSGACDALVQVECDDDDSDNGFMSKIDLTGQTPGETLFIRVFEYGGDQVGQFEISAINPNVAATNDLTKVGFNYYPNPVTDNLTMTANENITSVSIFNMLGQEVHNEKLSTLEANINMSNLSNGTYFVKAQVGQSIGTFKIVKK